MTTEISAINLAKYDFDRNLGLATISSKDLYTHIKFAIEHGSKRFQIAWTDFTFQVNSTADLSKVVDVTSAVRAGMPYLDAVYYFHGRGATLDRPITKRDPPNDVPFDTKKITQAVFAWYFTLYSQGSALPKGQNKFLKQVMNFGTDLEGLIKSLTTANIDSIPGDWIKEVKFDGLSVEAKNRLSLGAAGHRYLQAINYIKDHHYKENCQDAKDFLLGLREWTQGKIWWDLHPVDKNGEVITITKSLNKMIEDCFFHCLTDEAQESFVAASILFAKPTAQPTNDFWKVLNFNLLPKLVNPIIAETAQRIE